MADEQAHSVPKEGENSLKRKRDSDNESGSSSSQKDPEGLQSPPAKIAARDVEINLNSPPEALRRTSAEQSETTLPTSTASSSLEESQRKSTEDPGDEEKGGVEKMQ